MTCAAENGGLRAPSEHASSVQKDDVFAFEMLPGVFHHVQEADKRFACGVRGGGGGVVRCEV
jgi:hypothetical protein